MESAGIIAHCERESAVACARELYDYLSARGVRVRFPRELAEVLGLPGLGGSESDVAATDLLIALGGDGTVLAASRAAVAHGTPVLGVHAGGSGSFGFLTETTPAGARQALDQVLEGRYRVDARLMVSAEILRLGEHAAHFSALNDLVIRAQARMLKMQVSVEKTLISTYAADGIIVATPTGSTAYNLAAGGPLVHPAVETILLTPICPHTLNVRSLLVGIRDTIHVRMETRERDVTFLIVDGQISFQLEPGDEIHFRVSEQRARFISLEGDSFYEKVQTRLRLGERFGN